MKGPCSTCSQAAITSFNGLIESKIGDFCSADDVHCALFDTSKSLFPIHGQSEGFRQTRSSQPSLQTIVAKVLLDRTLSAQLTKEAKAVLSILL